MPDYESRTSPAGAQPVAAFFIAVWIGTIAWWLLCDDDRPEKVQAGPPP